MFALVIIQLSKSNTAYDITMATEVSECSAVLPKLLPSEWKYEVERCTRAEKGERMFRHFFLYTVLYD